MKARTTLWALFGLTAVLTTSAVAEAQDQPWLRDSRLTSGKGLGSDTVSVTGGVAAGATYDSNIFYRAGTPEAPRADAFVLSISPFLGVRTMAAPDGPKPSFGFNGQAAVTYYEYIAGPTKGLPQDDVSASRNVGANGMLQVIAAPGSRLSGELHGVVTRSIQPSNLGDPTASYNRTVPGVGTSVTWAPGGGLFSWKVGYDLLYTYFEANTFREFDNFTHIVASTANWRFLPRTTLFSTSTLTHYQYTSGNTLQTNGDGISTLVGLNGLVTNSFGFRVAGGWAATIFQANGGAPAQDFDSFVAQAEARFYLSAPLRKEDDAGVYPSTLVFGYTRDWNQSYIGDFYQRDRGYGSLGYFFNGVVLATLTGGVSRLGFPQTTWTDGTIRNAAFTNTQIDTTLFVEYRITPHFGVNVTGTYLQMLSDTRIRTDEANPVVGQDLQYTRYTATLGVRYLLLSVETSPVKFARSALVTILFSVGACASHPHHPGVLPAPVDTSTLGPGDVFEIVVVGETQFPKEYIVDPDGTANFPWIKRQAVAGLEPRGVADKVHDLLVRGHFLADPTVIVNVKQYNSKHVTLGGAIVKPGDVPFSPGLTLYRIITAAGGFTAIANRDNVLITRRAQDGRRVTVSFAVEDIAEGRSPDVPLQAGDTVYVYDRPF
jgi:protein involved in polysaccharide export with SLBB domain